MSATEHLKAAMRLARRNELLANMREGRVIRAATVPAKKGKGSYKRKPKHSS